MNAWQYAGTLLFLLGACDGSPDAVSSGPSSSTIVLAPEGSSVFLTSPDDSTVVELDADTLEERRRFLVAGVPEELAITADGLTVVVTLSASSDLATIAREDGTVSRMPTPCGGTRGIVVHAESGKLYVTCPNDGAVLEVDLVMGTTFPVVDALATPTALALEGDTLAVTESSPGRIRRFQLFGFEPISSPEVSLPAGIAATQMDAIAVLPGGVVSAYQQVDHDSDRSRPPERGGYGSVVDGNPRIEPRLAGACVGTRFARFDGGSRVASGPSALAAHGSVLWVAHRYTDNVLVLDCAAETGGSELSLLAAYRVGRGPRGIALSPDGRTAWIDEGFDHAVSRLTLTRDGDLHDPTATQRRTLGTTDLSEAALRGRSLFHDAVDTHLTPSGVLTCATCHPGGGQDGLSWFLHTAMVGPKLRRTPPAWGARRALVPFHWDGALPDGATLARATIQQLMEGDALLVDVEAIATYLDEVPAPPPRPLVAMDQMTTAVRGSELFAERCATCHTGTLTSDATVHAVIDPSLDPDGDLPEADTPTLAGIRTRAPFLHDGRAATLHDVLTTFNPSDRHGRTSDLSETDLSALELYLETL